MDTSPESPPVTQRVNDIIVQTAERGPSTRTLAIAAIGGVALAVFLLVAWPGKPPVHEQPLTGPTTDIDALSSAPSSVDEARSFAASAVEPPPAHRSADKASIAVASPASAERPPRESDIATRAPQAPSLSIVPVAAAAPHSEPDPVAPAPVRIVNVQEIEPSLETGASGRPAADLIVAAPIVRDRETAASVPDMRPVQADVTGR
jgi:hypothetical protein